MKAAILRWYLRNDYTCWLAIDAARLPPGQVLLDASIRVGS